jgi:membrane protease subunit (stomatin/prohibitin family)
MPRRRRPLMRAAAVGGIAAAAGKAGAKAGGEQADPNAPAEEPEAEQQAAPEDQAPVALSADESMEELTKLKGLLDSGVLTQDEFDAQKQKILQTM